MGEGLGVRVKQQRGDGEMVAPIQSRYAPPNDL